MSGKTIFKIHYRGTRRFKVLLHDIKHSLRKIMYNKIMLQNLIKIRYCLRGPL